MSQLTNAAETALLNLIFANTGWANIGDATGLRGSTVPGSFYLSLHTTDAGEAGDQTTNEIAYTGYARVAIVRSGAGWTIASENCTNAALVAFGACTAGTANAAFVGLGTASTGAGNLILRGTIGTPLAISAGITPQFAIGAITFTAA